MGVGLAQALSGNESRFGALLSRVRTGDANAMTRLLAEVRPRVLRWALVQLGDADDAEDLTQEIVVTVMQRVRALLADLPARSGRRGFRRAAPSRRVRRYVLSAGVAVAAGIAGLLFFPGSGERDGTVPERARRDALRGTLLEEK